MTPGSKSRSSTPTVFEQQREELVREIAVVGYTISDSSQCFEHRKSMPELTDLRREWNKFCKISTG